MVLSDLQVALIGAGLVAVAGVWAYNLWQEKKHRRMTEAAFKAHDDTLLNMHAEPPAQSPDFPAEQREEGLPPDGHGIDHTLASEMTASFGNAVIGERIEPTLPPLPGDEGEALTIAPAAAESAPEQSPHAEFAHEVSPGFAKPTHADAAMAAAEPETLSAAGSASEAGGGLPPLPADWADALSDCILRFATPEPTSAAALWMLQSAWADQMNKALRWLAFDDSLQHWVDIHAQSTGRHVHWAAALQLVDRRGPIAERTLTHYVESMQSLARQAGASIDVPDAAALVAHAAALDAFCAAVDIQFTVHLVESAGGIFSGTKLRGVAEASGMQLEKDGRFHARDSAGGELFTLSNLGSEGFSAENLRTLATHGLSLTLDVPRVHDGLATFMRMLAAGQQLARALEGVLVDAQRLPLSDDMTVAIRTKITELQRSLANAQIIPGSPHALRLFS
jgi:FtsZ-interacting cell division protein ZipA